MLTKYSMFIPSGAILLRLGLKNPIVLKLHAGLQILSYLLYIVAAGMGIWLAQQTSQFGTWDDPHPRLGLAILAIAFVRPAFSPQLPHKLTLPSFNPFSASSTTVYSNDAQPMLKQASPPSLPAEQSTVTSISGSVDPLSSSA
jgi:hypothetical protein